MAPPNPLPTYSGSSVDVCDEDPVTAKFRGLPPGRPATPSQRAALAKSKADAANGVRGMSTTEIVAKARELYGR